METWALRMCLLEPVLLSEYILVDYDTIHHVPHIVIEVPDLWLTWVRQIPAFFSTSDSNGSSPSRTIDLLC